MMFSSRHATGVILLLTLSAVPTVIHSYMDSTRSDGRAAREIPRELAGAVGSPTSRRATWGAEQLSAGDWIERTYAGSSPVKLFVGRSYDLKKLYHHPELAVDYGSAYASHQIVSVAARPEVPVHALRGGASNPQRLGLYVLEYDGTYVANPIAFQLRASFELLTNRRRAMTLFFATQQLPEGTAAETSAAAAILTAAIESFESQARR